MLGYAASAKNTQKTHATEKLYCTIFLWSSSVDEVSIKYVTRKWVLSKLKEGAITDEQIRGPGIQKQSLLLQNENLVSSILR